MLGVLYSREIPTESSKHLGQFWAGPLMEPPLLALGPIVGEDSRLYMLKRPLVESSLGAGYAWRKVQDPTRTPAADEILSVEVRSDDIAIRLTVRVGSRQHLQGICLVNLEISAFLDPLDVQSRHARESHRLGNVRAS